MPTLEQYKNNYETQLNGAIDDNDTTITVDTGPSTMTGRFRIRIDDEIIFVGAASGTSFTSCVRGIEGTTAASHSDNAVVTHVLTMDSLKIMEDPILDLFGTPDTAFEFNTTSLTGLTALGTPDTESAHTTVPGHLLLVDDDSSQVGRYASVSTPCTMIVKMTDFVHRTQYQYTGVFCGESTPGKMVWIGTHYDGAFGYITARTFATPGDQTPGTPTLQTVPTPHSAGSANFETWFAIVASSSTDVDYYWSRNGRVFWPLFLNHNNSMTVGSMGVAMTAYASSTKAQAIYDYIRIWNSALTIPSFE